MGSISVNKSVLEKALIVGGQFAGKSKVMPILDCVKVAILNDTLKVTSSNIENMIVSKSVIDSIDGELSFCVNYKDLASYIKLIDSYSVKLDIEETLLKISHKNGSKKIPISDINDFPKFQKDNDYKVFDVDANNMHYFMSKSSIFASNDDLRPQLCGVFMGFSNNNVDLCATNRYSLYTQSFSDEVSDEAGVIINRGVLPSISAMCQYAKDKINIKIGSSNAVFSNGDVTVSFKIIEGRYPNFKSIIPRDNNNKATIKTDDLVKAINMATCGTKNPVLKFSFSNNLLELSSQDLDFSVFGDERLACECDFNMVVGVSKENILNILSTVRDENTSIMLKDKSFAFLITNGDSVKYSETFILMPAMLNE